MESEKTGTRSSHPLGDERLRKPASIEGKI
jgi:hypothetical protein